METPDNTTVPYFNPENTRKYDSPSTLSCKYQTTQFLNSIPKTPDNVTISYLHQKKHQTTQQFLNSIPKTPGKTTILHHHPESIRQHNNSSSPSWKHQTPQQFLNSILKTPDNTTVSQLYPETPKQTGVLAELTGGHSVRGHNLVRTKDEI